jgi:hypothetical protein
MELECGNDAEAVNCSHDAKNAMPGKRRAEHFRTRGSAALVDTGGQAMLPTLLGIPWTFRNILGLFSGRVAAAKNNDGRHGQEKQSKSFHSL